MLWWLAARTRVWIKRPNISRLNSVIRNGGWPSRPSEKGGGRRPYGALELGKTYVYSVSLIFIFPGEIPTSDSTKSSPSSSTINEFPVLNIKLYNPS